MNDSNVDSIPVRNTILTVISRDTGTNLVPFQNGLS